MTLRIRVVPRGPLVVEPDGDVELSGPDGAPLAAPSLRALRFCRCGASSARPFCDGSHHRVGFERAPEPPEPPEPPEEGEPASSARAGASTAGAGSLDSSRIGRSNEPVASPPWPAGHGDGSCAGLSLERFGVAFGARVVLASVTLCVPDRAITTLMGPVGVGKSTLVRTLSGANDAATSLRTWGRCTLGGRALEPHAVALVGQGARALVGTVAECLTSGLALRGSLGRPAQRDRAAGVLEWLGFDHLRGKLDDAALELPKGELRCLMLAMAMAREPAVLLLDEPTAGLAEADRLLLREAIRRASSRAAVLVVTHDQADARALEGTAALLAGGAIVEQAPTATFFGAPSSRIAQAFVETGSCAVVSPPSLDELVADGIVARERLVSASTEKAQSGTWAAFVAPELALRWVVPERLAGVPRPGLLGGVERDLERLVGAGVRLLVCLEEAQVLPHDVLARFGLECFALPIPDMDVPSFDEALTLSEVIREGMARGAVAVHCRAGLGRTGTVLAAHLMTEGLGREQALAKVRLAEPRFVQSERQLEFLASFEPHLRARRAASASTELAR